MNDTKQMTNGRGFLLTPPSHPSQQLPSLEDNLADVKASTPPRHRPVSVALSRPLRLRQTSRFITASSVLKSCHSSSYHSGRRVAAYITHLTPQPPGTALGQIIEATFSSSTV
ncbi:hypothetical protein RRG08_009969 [Elysia crispata]|uniref:Uncharacterized protein n=1 Tax=Elysia crispata TaxID=231223 RepID=A0AAE1E9N1_9GAST|nr:hypothetical protein RRG08_009969 [Elysia crispata]